MVLQLYGLKINNCMYLKMPINITTCTTSILSWILSLKSCTDAVNHQSTFILSPSYKHLRTSFSSQQYHQHNHHHLAFVTSSHTNNNSYTKLITRYSSSTTSNQNRINDDETTHHHNSSIIQKDNHLKPLQINLLTIKKPQLETLLQSWSIPKYRATQILQWIHDKGVTNIDDMNNLPKDLRAKLKEYTSVGTLNLEVEMISKDGTRKRAYRLWDGQLIESVLMPYEDGRNTACISSQAGCAMGCVFCATGQMGFARQLTPDEIFEQVAIFSSELKQQNQRLSNIVMMGMGEPLANYKNVFEAIRRMNTELGIGARKITVSTVGVVPNIRKLMEEDIQVRLAISLHNSNDEERSALLPANKRYGGLDELMMTIKDYIDTTGRRVTFEWALIENKNDNPDVARELGRLLERFGIRKDMAHINLIPLNPTGGYVGSPTARTKVDEFVKVLQDEFGIKATPRVRRGIDIEAGCGQLKAAVKRKEESENLKETTPAALSSQELKSFIEPSKAIPNRVNDTNVGVYEDDEDEGDNDDVQIISSREENTNKEETLKKSMKELNSLKQGSIVEFTLMNDAVDIDDQDFDDEEYDHDFDKQEADRLIQLIKGTKIVSTTDSIMPEPNIIDDTLPVILVGDTTSITDEESVDKARRRRKKILKNLKAIDKLKQMQNDGISLNSEQLSKVSKEEEWRNELESVEHNLQ